MSEDTLLVRAIRDSIIVSDMFFGDMRTTFGIIIPNDDGKSYGVKPRWSQVYTVGPDQKDVVPGEWVLVEHGRWTRGFDFDLEDGSKFTLRRIDADAILLVSDEKPSDTQVAPDKLLDLHTN